MDRALTASAINIRISGVGFVVFSITLPLLMFVTM